jgi:Putative Ig domain
MIHAGWSRGARGAQIEPPIELRFVDLFMILVTTLIFITVVLSIVSAFVGTHEEGKTPPPLGILTRTLPAALQGRSFEVTLAASGGRQVYRWELAGGRLPAGLRLNKEGRIFGIPGQVQATEVLVRVHDGNGSADERRLALSVEPAGSTSGKERRARPQVMAPRVLLPDARAETAYKFELGMNGGVPPFRWKLAHGELPRGLRLSPDGAVLGVPRKKNEMTQFAVRVTDASRRQWRQDLALRVAPPPPTLTWRILKWVFWIWFAISVISYARLVWTGGVVEFPSGEKVLKRILRRA